MKIHSILFSVLLGTVFAVNAAKADSFAHPTDKLGVLESTAVEGVNWNTGRFVDFLNFTVDAANNNVFASFSDLDRGVRLNIRNFDIDLYHRVDNTWKFVTDIGFGDDQTYNGILDAGKYSFRVSGFAFGVRGGKYEYSVSAVPEPGELALMLSGLGLMGYMARRRASRQA